MIDLSFLHPLGLLPEILGWMYSTLWPLATDSLVRGVAFMLETSQQAYETLEA